MDFNFKCDIDKCTGCGLCTKVCGTSVLHVIDGVACMDPVTEVGWDGCFRCQHCLAVCPEGAISILGKDPADSLPPHLAQGPERTVQEATVSSLRADAVLAAMMHTSRSRAADYIAAGRVEVNHLALQAPHAAVYARDVFTVRGVGRYRLTEIGGKSRKDRVFISFFQY